MSHGDHPRHLQHHFETSTQQYEASKLGMWLFLVTEVLLFGGLFCWYTVARANEPGIFYYGHQFLNPVLGGINTVVLILSSLTMALAVWAAQTRRIPLLKKMLAATLLFACCFLAIKFVEYQEKWKHGLLWGTQYQPHGEEHGEEPAEPAPVEPAPAPAGEEGAPADPDAPKIAPAARGPEGLAEEEASEADPHDIEKPKNVHLFFGIYFVMTGTHGLHVLAGMAVIFWLLLRARKGHFDDGYFTPVDLGGLYWHLVDVIWIFLFPLLYLIH
jgi:cytochrome c oxidase subunit 3